MLHALPIFAALHWRVTIKALAFRMVVLMKGRVAHVAHAKACCKISVGRTTSIQPWCCVRPDFLIHILAAVCILCNCYQQ